MEHPIGALPRTPFPASRDFAPVGSMSLDFQVASLSYKSSSFATSRGNEKYGEEKQRVIYFMYHSAVSPFGGERSKPMTGMLIMPYGTESKSRNADFISIALRAIHNPRANGPSNLRTLRPSGRSILRTLFLNPSTQPAADRRPQPSGRSPVNPHARRACPMLLFFQYAAEGVFFSVFSVFHVDALDFRGEAGEGVDAVY